MNTIKKYLSCPQAIAAILLVACFIIFISQMGKVRWVPVILYSLVYLAAVAFTCKSYSNVSWIIVIAPILLPYIMSIVRKY